MKYINAIEFGLTNWIHDRQTWKYLSMLFAIMFVAMLIVGGIFAVLFMPIIQNPETVNPISFISSIFFAIMILIPIAIIAGLISMYVMMLIRIRALQIAGHNPPALGWIKLIKIIILEILTGLFATFSVYRPKWLILLAADIVLYFGGIMLMGTEAMWGMILILLSVLGFLAYFVVIIYNSLRLCFPITIFIDTEISIFDSLKKSEEITNGRVMSILGTSLVFGIIVGIIAAVIGGIIEAIVSLPFIGIFGAEPSAEVLMQNIGILTVLLVFMLLLRTLLQLFISVVGNFFTAGIYNLVLQDQGTASPASNQISSTPPSEKVIRAAMK